MTCDVPSIFNRLFSKVTSIVPSETANIILRLDRIMADRKITLNGLSNAIGISNVNLSNIKTGKIKAIRFSTLNEICKILKCQPGDILEYVDDALVDPNDIIFKPE